MADFMVNTDMFGQYVRIPTGYSREMHIYKVVSKFKTNSYCDVPILGNSKPILHTKEYHDLNDLEDVLNVIHCGINETEVLRVALKDCEIVTPTEDVVPRSEIEKAKQETFDEAIEKIENIMDLVAQYYRDNEGDEGRQLEYQAQHLGLNKARYILLDLKKKHIGE
jgi:hypothetical protein